MAYEGMIAETVGITGHNGEKISAYVARPLGVGKAPIGGPVHLGMDPGPHLG